MKILRNKKTNLALFLILMISAFDFICANNLKNKLHSKNKNSNDPLYDMSNEYYTNLFSNKNQEIDSSELKAFNSLKDFAQINSSNKSAEMNLLEMKTNNLNSNNNNNQKFSYDHFFPNYQNYQNKMLSNILGNKDNNDFYNNNRDSSNNNSDAFFNNNNANSFDEKLKEDKDEVSFIKKSSYPFVAYHESAIAKPMGAEMIPVIKF